MDEQRKLAKNLSHRRLAGVCAGFADYFRVDPNLVRILTVFLAIATGGAGVLLYIIASFLLPVRAEDRTLGLRTSVLNIVLAVVLIGAIIALVAN